MNMFDRTRPKRDSTACSGTAGGRRTRSGAISGIAPGGSDCEIIRRAALRRRDDDAAVPGLGRAVQAHAGSASAEARADFLPAGMSRAARAIAANAPGMARFVPHRSEPSPGLGIFSFRAGWTCRRQPF